MHDIVLDIVLDIATALLLVLATATFAAMIWAARKVDGREHAAPRIQLPHPHLRRHA
jgi:hypothetical protein